MPTLVNIIQQDVLQNSMNVLFSLVTYKRSTWRSMEKYGRKYLMKETEKMGKKCMHVTDIYKMCGSSQASGTKKTSMS